MFNRITAKAIKKSFPILQTMGFHLTQNHFYEPIPDTRYLKKSLWNKKRFIEGINYQEKKQLSLLSVFVKKYKKEYSLFSLENDNSGYYIKNGMFESIDGEILYCMIRHIKPERIIEIGSGFTSLLIEKALSKNAKGKLTIIDPYPEDVYKYGNNIKHTLIKNKIENVSLSEFEKLKENDILFIDSSHVLKIGSDVQFEMLEIFPRLKKGVIVHIHDIFLPSEYPFPHVTKNYMFWNEQYVLHAFLQYNNFFQVLWGGSFMHLFHPEKLQKAFPSYNKTINWPGSFWIKKVK